MRVTEFCELTHDAIVKMNETNWLRLPVGKVHTDRYVPLHPSLIELHRTWRHWAGPTGLWLRDVSRSVILAAWGRRSRCGWTMRRSERCGSSNRPV